jgi:hypothetical protein
MDLSSLNWRRGRPHGRLAAFSRTPPTGAANTMNRRHLMAACAAACVAAALPARAQIVELAGVKIAPSAQVGGSTLQRNGAGIRYKFIVKVYTAALYLGSKAGTPEAVLAQPGPKRLHVVMLRDIDGNELGKLFTRGLQDNAPKAEFSKLIPGMLRFSDIFSAQKRLKAGDSFFLDYLPGQGTVVLVNGKATSEPIPEPEFYSAMLRIWLGPNPADSQLKEALLGRESQPVNSPGQQ